MFPLDKGLQWVNVKQNPYRNLGTFRHSQTYQGIIQAYSGILKTLCYSDIFCDCGISRTLIYSEPEAYSEPWYIQNPAIFRMLGYSKFEAYSEPCRTSTMKR